MDIMRQTTCMVKSQLWSVGLSVQLHDGLSVLKLKGGGRLSPQSVSEDCA